MLPLLWWNATFWPDAAKASANALMMLAVRLQVGLSLSHTEGQANKT